MSTQTNLVALSTIGPLPKNEEKDIQIGDATIHINTHLPYESILRMIEWCINYIVGDRSFISAPIEKMILDMAILKFYTNIDMSALNDIDIDVYKVYEMYDLCISYDVIEQVSKEVDQKQLQFFMQTVKDTMCSIVAYKNSALGVVEQLSDNANEITETMQNAIDTANDPEKLAAVRQFANVMAQQTNQ